jgi:hypothetical protein
MDAHHQGRLSGNVPHGTRKQAGAARAYLVGVDREWRAMRSSDMNKFVASAFKRMMCMRPGKMVFVMAVRQRDSGACERNRFR